MALRTARRRPNSQPRRLRYHAKTRIAAADEFDLFKRGWDPIVCVYACPVGRENMKRYEFYLHIPPEDYLDYYRGIVRQVLVRSTSGETVQFPASLLQRFVREEGICGDFVLTCDEHHKCVDLHRVDSTK